MSRHPVIDEDRLEALECPRCGTPAHRGTNFCSRCGASLRAASVVVDQLAPVSDRRRQVRHAADFERRQLTVVFCDLVNSTARALQTDPEDLNDAIDSFYQVVSDLMQQSGGYVARYVGDGVLVYFGFPKAHEDDAERAIKASLSTIEAVRSMMPKARLKFEARIGIATGIVVVGNLHASIVPVSHDIAGEAVHVAARLQAGARANSVIVAASTRRLVTPLFEWSAIGLRRLKGFPNPVEAWRVVGAKRVGSRFEARHGPLATPMLAREDLRAILMNGWQGAQDGRGSTVLVSGEPGIGKSRLAMSVVDEVRGGSGDVYQLSCAPDRQSSPLYPAIRLIEERAGFERSDSGALRLDKLRALLVGATVEDLLLICDLLSVPTADTTTLVAQSAQTRRLKTMQALIAMIERAALRAPVLLVFEDVQWSDETSRELIGHLVERLVAIPVLLLVLGRPEFVCPWSDRSDVTALTLAPLPVHVSTALVHLIAGSHHLSSRTVAHIVARTDGVPLFIEEVTSAVVETAAGTLVGDDVTVGVLPLSLQASLLSRLDRLGRAREVAEVASAIGRDFDSDLLRLVVDDAAQLDSLLAELVVSGLVQHQSDAPGRYAFKHALIRDAAYSLMIRDKRHSVHLRIADALQRERSDVVANHPEVLAWHYTEARVLDKAVLAWLAAGRRSLQRSAMAEALEQLRRGATMIEEIDDGPWRHRCELDLTIATGMGLIATQGYAIDSTKATFLKAQALCERLPDPPQALAVLHGLWTHSLLRGDFAEATRLADDVLARGEARGDRMWLLMGRRFRGVTCHPLGRFEEACEQLELGLALYDPSLQATYAALTVDDPRVVMLTYQSWSLMCLGRLDAARRCSERAIAEAEATAHVYTMAHALNGGAFVALTTGRYDEALDRLDELDAILADNGIAYYMAVAMIFRGYCVAAKGDFEAALPLLVSGMTSYRATGSTLYLSGFLRMSAEAHCWAGLVDVAGPLIAESAHLMKTTGQPWDEAETYRVQGNVARALGDPAAARRWFERAVALATCQGAGLWQRRAQSDLAALLSTCKQHPRSVELYTVPAAECAVLEGGIKSTPVP